jgi:hypothetical protein
MNRTLIVALFFVAAAARADFDSLVRAVESSHGMHRVWTPGISLVRFGVRIVHPEGVHDFQLVRFEGNGGLDFERILNSTPATPLIRTHNNQTGETAVIWARPLRGDLIEMLLVSHDPDDDTVVLRAVVDGEKLAKEIADPKHARSIAGE